MRYGLHVFLLLFSCGMALAQEDKKTDDLKPADPDTGESTVEERTLGLLPNPFEKQGIKFAVTYIGEVLGTRPVASSEPPSTKIASISPSMPISKS